MSQKTFPNKSLFDCNASVQRNLAICLTVKLFRNYIERGFHEKQCKKTVKQVAEMDRKEFLQDKTQENKGLKKD